MLTAQAHVLTRGRRADTTHEDAAGHAKAVSVLQAAGELQITLLLSLCGEDIWPAVVQVPPAP